MANLNQPKGFEPKGTAKRVNPYVAGTELFPGDMLMWGSSGTEGQLIASAGGAAEKLVGVALSYASAQAATVIVSDDPEQLYVVQADSTSVDNANDVSKYCEVKATAGNATFKQSRQEIDTVAATDTKPLQIVEIDTRVGNAVGDSCKVVVKINPKAFAA